MTAADNLLAGLERRRMTIVFGDFEGYTSVTEATDPEVVAEVIGNFFQLVRKEVERAGGVLVRTMGDGFLAVYGTPQAREDDARRAIESAVVIQRIATNLQQRMEARLGRALRLRIGINTGQTVASTRLVDGDDPAFTGDAINVASRLESLAPPGGILVSDETRQLAIDDFTWGEPSTFALRNRLAPVIAYEVLETVEEQRPIARVESSFFGREAELSKLGVAWSSVKVDRSQVMIIRGPAGAGKSRLLHEFLARLDDQPDPPAVAFASASPRPAGVLDPIKRMVIGSLSGGDVEEAVSNADASAAVATLLAGDSDQSPNDRSALRSGLVSFFREWLAGRPGMIVLEDAQWADGASIRLLAEIQSKLADEPVLFLFLTRNGTGKQLPRRVRNAASVLTVGPLGPADSEALLASLVRAGTGELPRGAVAQVLAASEGVPLFIEEIARLLLGRGDQSAQSPLDAAGDDGSEWELPGTVEQIFLARLDEIEPRSRQLAREAAVIGRAFPDELLAAISDAPAGISKLLLRLENADFVRYRESLVGDGHEFTTFLTWNTLYESLLIRQREELHLRIAETMERMYPESRTLFAEELASHYELGGRPELAAHYYLQASQKSRVVFASPEARSQRRRAAQLVGLTSLWANTADDRNGSLRQRLATASIQAVIALLLLAPALLFLVAQGPDASDRTLGFPDASFDPNSATVAVPLLLGVLPVFLAALLVVNLRGPAYIEPNVSRSRVATNIGVDFLAVTVAAAVVAAVVYLGVRLGILGPIADVLVWSLARRVLDSGGWAIVVTLLVGLAAVAAALEIWVLARSRRWYAYLRTRSDIQAAVGDKSDRRPFGKLARVVFWASLANALLVALYALRLLPPGADRAPIQPVSAILFSLVMAAMIATALLLWAHAKRESVLGVTMRSTRDVLAGLRAPSIRSSRQGRQPSGLGFEVPLALAVLAGFVVALLARQSVLDAQKDVFEPVAYADADQLVSLFPRSPYSYALRGNAIAAPDERPPGQAADDYARALELDEGFISAHGGLAGTRLNEGDFEGALASATTLVDLEPDHPTPYNLRAIPLLISGEPARFLADLKTAADMEAVDPSWDWLYARCQARLMNRQHQEALDDCLLAGENNSYLYGPGGFRGPILMLLRALGREAEARVLFSDAGLTDDEITLMLSTVTSADLPETYPDEQLRHVPLGALYDTPEHHRLSAEHGVTDGYLDVLRRDRSTEFDGRDVLVAMVTTYETTEAAERGFDFHVGIEAYDSWRTASWPSDAESRAMASTIVDREQVALGDEAERIIYRLSGDGLTAQHDVAVVRAGTTVWFYVIAGRSDSGAEDVARLGLVKFDEASSADG